MNTQPPFEDAPNAAGTGTEQVTDAVPAADSLTGAFPGDPAPAPFEPVADAVLAAEEDADLDDLLPGANPVPAGEAVFVVETDYMPADLPPETGAALSAAVDAAEAAAESAADAAGDAVPEDAPVVSGESFSSVFAAVEEAEEDADLDDLLPGANPVPAGEAVFAVETDYLPADLPPETGAALSAAVDAAEAAAADAPAEGYAEDVGAVMEAVAEAEEIDLDDLLPGANPLPVGEAEPVFAAVAEETAIAPPEPLVAPEPAADLTVLTDAVDAVVAAEAEEIVASAGDSWSGAPEPVGADAGTSADAVAEAEETEDLDDLLPGAHPVPAEIEAAAALDTGYMPAELPAATGAALVAAVDAAEAAAEAAADADASGEDADSLDDLLPEVDPLMVAMVAEDAAEHATTEAEAVAVLEAVSGAVGGVIAEAEHTRQRLGASSPAELWLKMWARSVDFWIAGAKRKD